MTEQALFEIKDEMFDIILLFMRIVQNACWYPLTQLEIIALVLQFTYLINDYTVLTYFELFIVVSYILSLIFFSLIVLEFLM